MFWKIYFILVILYSLVGLGIDSGTSGSQTYDATTTTTTREIMFLAGQMVGPKSTVGAVGVSWLGEL